jgi:hypothetical protein
VEVICRARRNEVRRGPQFQLNRPRLLDGERPIPVEVGLWSVGLPRSSSKRGVEGAAIVSAVEQAALRLDRLVSIAETATSAAVDLPLSEGRDWYLPWADRLRVIRQHALLTVERPADGTAVLQVASTSEQQLAEASEQLDTWIEQCDEIFELSDTQRPLESSVDQIVAAPWDHARRAGSRWINCVADGDSAQILVNLDDQVSTPSQSRIRDLLLIGGAAAVAIALMRRPVAGDLLWRWPQTAAFLVGMAYWAWLWPSWIGLLIAAASVWLAMRPGWPGHSVRTEGSTVMGAPGGEK